jgi:hypothetical protein
MMMTHGAAIVAVHSRRLVPLLASAGVMPVTGDSGQGIAMPFGGH